MMINDSSLLNFISSVTSSRRPDITNSKPLYVSSPRAGFYDIYPVGSPEQSAFAANANNGYAAYQFNQRARAPMVYVGSNDGMLHAINATTGDESWAYVPNTLIQNRRLARSTADTAGLTPGVDHRRSPWGFVGHLQGFVV